MGSTSFPQMIEISRGKAAQAGADVTFQLGSIDDIPFPAQQFDAVLCSFMIFHMSEDVRRQGHSARSSASSSRRDGLLVVDMALPTNPLQRAIVNAFFGAFLKHDLRELLPLLEESGFSDIEWRRQTSGSSSCRSFRTCAPWSPKAG